MKTVRPLFLMFQNYSGTENSGKNRGRGKSRTVRSNPGSSVDRTVWAFDPNDKTTHVTTPELCVRPTAPSSPLPLKKTTMNHLCISVRNSRKTKKTQGFLDIPGHPVGSVCEEREGGGVRGKQPFHPSLPTVNKTSVDFC